MGMRVLPKPGGRYGERKYLKKSSDLDKPIELTRICESLYIQCWPFANCYISFHMYIRAVLIIVVDALFAIQLDTIDNS